MKAKTLSKRILAVLLTMVLVIGCFALPGVFADRAAVNRGQVIRRESVLGQFHADLGRQRFHFLRQAFCIRFSVQDIPQGAEDHVFPLL